jgi:hypothetical protein
VKALLVTSRVTFVPRNYDDLVCGLAENRHVGGLLVIDNASPRLLGRALGLVAVGARGVGGALLKNRLGRSARRRKAAFARAGKPVWTLPTVNCDRALELVRDKGFDLVINARTRVIYKHPILAAPRLGCINVHHGLLPDQRGTMCDLWALYRREPAGFSIHRMIPAIDAGDILARVQVSDGDDRDYPRYLQRSAQREVTTVAEVLARIAVDNRVLGEPNVAPQGLAHCKTPSRHQVGQFRREGIRV